MNKKQIILTTVITVVVIIGLIIGGKILADQQTQKKIDAIHAAYTEAIETNISAYLGRSESEMSIDQKMYDITDVTFEVDGIFFGLLYAVFLFADHNSARVLLEDLSVVSHHYDGCALVFVDAGQKFHNAVCCLVVEVACRLVSYDYLRVIKQ